MTITQLEMHEASRQKDGAVGGSFTLSCHELGVSRTFKFRVVEEKSQATIWKDGKVFLKQDGILTKESLVKYNEQQKIVLCGFIGIYRLSRGWLEGVKAGMRMQSPIPKEKLLDFLAALR